MKTYIVGNWKLNFTVGEASIYLHKLLKALPISRNLEVVIAPSSIALQPLSLQIDRRKLKLSAQNAFYRDYGSFSGEISFAQLRSVADYCIIGHSERRHIFHETDKDIREKVTASLRNKITPILCIGETESERSFGETADVIRDQLLGGLSEVSEEDLSKVIIAYAPVWAMSSTKTSRLASPDEVSEAIQLIRTILKDTFNSSISEKILLLFEGGVRPTNAGAYLTIPGINGLLVGSASLILSEFVDIIKITKRVIS